ncbi:MAG: fumarylacetoacetate hydrolase family protein [Chloroflexi bacterium]|nr:fumarylacetoacetate hydrolase family protein [Chloroflexota bacterium]
MKLLLFDDGRPGVLRGDGVVDITDAVRPVTTARGQEAMQAIIANFDRLQSELIRYQRNGERTPLAGVKLLPPLPRPGKILAMGGNFSEFGHRPPAPMWGFTKSSDAVIGPGDTCVLPPIDANIFHHEPELVLVFGRAGKSIKAANAMDYVFGYTCGVDVSARIPAVPGAAGGGPRRDALPLSAHKSHPTFAPLGPWIVTKDEIPDPQNVQVRLWDNGELRGDYNTSDINHSIAASIEFATGFEGVSPGDVFYLGTNHQGLGAMQDGDAITIEIDRVGRMSFTVRDPLKRRWARGVDQLTAEDVRTGAGGPGRRQRPL